MNSKAIAEAFEAWANNMGMLEDGEEHLRQWRIEHLTVQVRYNGSPDVIPATQGESFSTTEYTDGLAIHSKSVDWLIDVLHMRDELPKPHDTIEYNDAFYEVVDSGGKCWEWHGRTHRTYRIHTRIISFDVYWNLCRYADPASSYDDPVIPIQQYLDEP